jgi:hypothetical protein
MTEELRKAAKVERVFKVELVGSDGTVHASVEKTIHVSRATPSDGASTPAEPSA